MFADGFAYGVNLIEGLFDRIGAEDFGGDPDGEEDAYEAAFAHAGDINVAVCVAGREIEFGVEEALRSVVVGVDDNGGGLQLFGLVGNGLGGGGDDH